MNYKLFTALQCSGATLIAFLTAKTVQANPTEYVFSAPPEIDNELVEIPQSETDYPFYECSQEFKNQETEAAMDSHDCECLDCDDTTQDSESNEQVASQNQKNKK